MSAVSTKSRFLYLSVPVFFAAVCVILGSFLAAYESMLCYGSGGIEICNVYVPNLWENYDRFYHVSFDETAANVHWRINIVASAAMGLIALLGFFTPYKTWLYKMVFRGTISASLVVLASAGLITGVSVKVVNSANAVHGYSDKVRLSASGMGMVWGMAASALLCVVSWVLLSQKGTFNRNEEPSKEEAYPQA